MMNGGKVSRSIDDAEGDFLKLCYMLNSKLTGQM